MRILVTGAGGYIGRHLVPKLQAAGHNVIPLRNWPCEPHRSAYDEAGELTLVGDLSLGCGNLVREDIKPDTVIHLAGRVEISLLPNPAGAHLPPIPGPCDIGALYRDNVLATANVLQYCLQAGVKHLIFASTQAAYGMGDNSEDRDLVFDPLEHYAVSKVAAECILEMGSKQGLMISVLRLPAVFGGDRKEGAVYSMCRDAMQKGEIHVTRTYPLPMNAMHVDDVVSAFVAAVAWQPPNENWAEGLSVNISGRYEGCSLNRIADEIASLVPKCKVWAELPEHPELYIDGGLAQKMLNWHPKARKERLAQVLEEIKSEL